MDKRKPEGEPKKILLESTDSDMPGTEGYLFPDDGLVVLMTAESKGYPNGSSGAAMRNKALEKSIPIFTFDSHN